MRTSILVATLVLVGALAAPAVHYALPSSGVTLIAMAAQEPAAPPSQAQPPAPPTTAPPDRAAQPAPDQSSPAPVNVEVVNRRWEPTPTWIAIGAIAIVLVVIVVFMATRTGSNTVIRG